MNYNQSPYMQAPPNYFPPINQYPQQQQFPISNIKAFLKFNKKYCLYPQGNSQQNYGHNRPIPNNDQSFVVPLPAINSNSPGPSVPSKRNYSISLNQKSSSPSLFNISNQNRNQSNLFESEFSNQNNNLKRMSKLMLAQELQKQMEEKKMRELKQKDQERLLDIQYLKDNLKQSPFQRNQEQMQEYLKQSFVNANSRHKFDSIHQDVSNFTPDNRMTNPKLRGHFYQNYENQSVRSRGRSEYESPVKQQKPQSRERNPSTQRILEIEKKYVISPVMRQSQELQSSRHFIEIDHGNSQRASQEIFDRQTIAKKSNQVPYLQMKLNDEVLDGEYDDLDEEQQYGSIEKFDLTKTQKQKGFEKKKIIEKNNDHLDQHKSNQIIVQDSDESRQVTPVLTKRNIRSLSNGHQAVNRVVKNPFDDLPVQGARDYDLNDLEKNSFNEKQMQLLQRKLNPQMQSADQRLKRNTFLSQNSFDSEVKSEFLQNEDQKLTQNNNINLQRDNKRNSNEEFTSILAAQAQSSISAYNQPIRNEGLRSAKISQQSSLRGVENLSNNGSMQKNMKINIIPQEYQQPRVMKRNNNHLSENYTNYQFSNRGDGKIQQLSQLNDNILKLKGEINKNFQENSNLMVRILEDFKKDKEEEAKEFNDEKSTLTERKKEQERVSPSSMQAPLNNHNQPSINERREDPNKIQQNPINPLTKEEIIQPIDLSLYPPIPIIHQREQITKDTQLIYQEVLDVINQPIKNFDGKQKQPEELSSNSEKIPISGNFDLTEQKANEIAKDDFETGQKKKYLAQLVNDSIPFDQNNNFNIPTPQYANLKKADDEKNQGSY